MGREQRVELPPQPAVEAPLPVERPGHDGPVVGRLHGVGEPRRVRRRQLARRDRAVEDGLDLRAHRDGARQRERWNSGSRRSISRNASRLARTSGAPSPATRPRSGDRDRPAASRSGPAASSAPRRATASRRPRFDVKALEQRGRCEPDLAGDGRQGEAPGPRACGIAVELLAAGATVYVSGRSTRTAPSPMGAPRVPALRGRARPPGRHGRHLARRRAMGPHVAASETPRFIGRVAAPGSGSRRRALGRPGALDVAARARVRRRRRGRQPSGLGRHYAERVAGTDAAR